MLGDEDEPVEMHEVCQKARTKNTIGEKPAKVIAQRLAEKDEVPPDGRVPEDQQDQQMRKERVRARLRESELSEDEEMGESPDLRERLMTDEESTTNEVWPEKVPLTWAAFDSWK